MATWQMVRIEMDDFKDAPFLGEATIGNQKEIGPRVAADAETAPRVRFTSSDDNFPFVGTLRAVSYSVIYIILSACADRGLS